MAILNKYSYPSPERDKILHLICFCTTQLIEASGLSFVVGTLTGGQGNAPHSCTILTSENNEGYITYSLIIDDKKLLGFADKGHTPMGITYEVTDIARNILDGDGFLEWYFQLVDLTTRILTESRQIEKMDRYMNYANNKLM